MRPRCSAIAGSISSRAVASSDGEIDDAQRFRGLEVEDEIILGRRLHRQVSRLCAVQDTIDIAGRAAPLLDPGRSRRTSARRLTAK